jgi:hypothetical protein
VEAVELEEMTASLRQPFLDLMLLLLPAAVVLIGLLNGVGGGSLKKKIPLVYISLMVGFVSLVNFEVNKL